MVKDLTRVVVVAAQGGFRRLGDWILLDCGLKCVAVQWLVGLYVVGQWLGCRCGC